MGEPTNAYIGLGSNLRQREQSIRAALNRLAGHGDIDVTRVSALYRTAPLGPCNQPDYVNGVAEVRTTLTPHELLIVLKATEDALGRRREGKWGPRTIDLDLLLFGREAVDALDLTVPHPQMHLRSFVLRGLCELDAELIHPMLKESVGALAERLNGCDFSLDPSTPQLVSIAGIIGVGKTTLARKLAGVLKGAVLPEPYDTNPYLPEVYAGHGELALDSQLYFLVHRADQLAADALAAGQVFLADYVFEKELIYARQLLDGLQWDLYERIYLSMAGRVTPPVLAIYLQDSCENCLQRIRRRNRPYEQDITADFLAHLETEYEGLFADWKTCPLMRVSAETIIAGGDAAVERLAAQIRAYIAVQKDAAVTET